MPPKNKGVDLSTNLSGSKLYDHNVFLRKEHSNTFVYHTTKIFQITKY